MKIFTGEVTSTKMNKTATVAVKRVVIHPVYKKRFIRTKRYHVHDEFGVKVGDEVKFIASKPYSKKKKWKVVEVVDKSKKEKDIKKSRIKSKPKVKRKKKE